MTRDVAVDRPVLTLRRFAELREAYRNKDLKQALYDEGGVVMADCLLTLHGEAHRDRRRLENRLFRRETFARFEREVMPATIERTLAPFFAAGRADLIEIGHRTTMNLTADIAGVDRPRQDAEETDALYGFVRTFSEGATAVHSTRDRAEVRAEVTAALAAFDHRFLQPSIRRRRQMVERGDALPADVLSTLLVNEDRLALPDDVVRREIAFYLQAGSHSTANAFAHTLDELWSGPGGADAVAVRRDDMPFLQRAVHEALRLHPASPVAWRLALADTEIAGHAVPAGTLVVLDLEAANRDPGVFGPHADRFDPERDLPDGVAPWGHSFGGGMHACIGAELDGGTAWSDDASVAGRHLFGTVAVLVAAVLRAGGRPDPDARPERDPTSARAHFGRYPVVFS